MSPERPLLLHLAMSHYNEKARWALDYKRIDHTRRAVMPGVHVAIAKRAGGDTTFPVMIAGDRVYRDSAEIIAGLEALKPDPPLLPSDPDERRRALLIQKEFDDIYAPAVRALAYQSLLEDRAAFTRFLAFGGPPLRRPLVRLMSRPLATAIRQVHRVPDADDPRPLETTERGLTRLDELLSESSSGYLAGDEFSVADLTVCSILAAGVCPEQFEGGGLPPWPEPLASTLAGLRERHPSAGWVSATYRSHRHPQAAEDLAVTSNM